ncbi:hypothetical protein GCM10022252_69860 [Streptosporangium oxazolinicum]|uniref:Uncharacterized protein n=1 Tax=Streptosporangium oxazolinicum TaxID=909287 RepID=A0ABP8BHE4_9ACTN
MGLAARSPAPEGDLDAREAPGAGAAPSSVPPSRPVAHPVLTARAVAAVALIVQYVPDAMGDHPASSQESDLAGLKGLKWTKFLKAVTPVAIL